MTQTTSTTPEVHTRAELVAGLRECADHTSLSNTARAAALTNAAFTEGFITIEQEDAALAFHLACIKRGDLDALPQLFRFYADTIEGNGAPEDVGAPIVYDLKAAQRRRAAHGFRVNAAMVRKAGRMNEVHVLSSATLCAGLVAAGVVTEDAIDLVLDSIKADFAEQTPETFAVFQDRLAAFLLDGPKDEIPQKTEGRINSAAESMARTLFGGGNKKHQSQHVA